MSESELRLHRVCFTGHRPEKLTQPTWLIEAWLESTIRKLIDEGYTTFISGCAMGVDLMAAKIVLKMREMNPDKNIRLICAMPFPGFQEKRLDGTQGDMELVLKSADLVKYISGRYIGKQVFQIRNVWMVDHSNVLVAVYDGHSTGGTKNTIAYAKRAGIDVLLMPVNE